MLKHGRVIVQICKRRHRKILGGVHVGVAQFVFFGSKVVRFVFAIVPAAAIAQVMP